MGNTASVAISPEKRLLKTTEQLVAEAELAELRRLTPEQEAAAATAAQRIREVAAAAKAAPKQEKAAPKHRGQEWWAIFGGGAIEPLLEHTPLIDLEYLVALAEVDGVMPCGQQNVPPAAFITARDLWRLKLWGKVNNKASLGVLVLSYPWLDWFHPDRLGAQLRRLLPFLKVMLAAAKRDSPHCTVGVMIDFLCLPQKPFATEEESARFGVSLNHMHAWHNHGTRTLTLALALTTPTLTLTRTPTLNLTRYHHGFTTTLLVTTPPPEGAVYSNSLARTATAAGATSSRRQAWSSRTTGACSTSPRSTARPNSAITGTTRRRAPGRCARAALRTGGGDLRTRAGPPTRAGLRTNSAMPTAPARTRA